MALDHGPSPEDGPSLGRRLQAKIWRHGRRLSRELLEQVRFIHRAFSDPATPLQVKLTIAGALAYFLLPADALPDFLPVLGFSDDAAVVGLALRRLQEIMAAQRTREQRAATVQLETELGAIRRALDAARHEAAILRHEALKWRRTAKALTLLVAALSSLLIWVMLS